MARIVFDLDGTLIDSLPDIHGVATTVLAREGRDPISLGVARSFIGDGTAVFVERMRRARSIPESEQDRLLSTFLSLYEGAVARTRPYPGVEATLDILAHHHRLGVCTNKPTKPTRSVLAHLDLARWFEVIIGGDSLPERKPDPAPLRAAFDALGDGPRIYVGDSEVDAETARRAEAPFLLYTEGYRRGAVAGLPHVAAFSDWRDLPGVVADALRYP